MTREEEILKLVNEQYKDDSWHCWPEFPGTISLDKRWGDVTFSELMDQDGRLPERRRIREVPYE